MAFFILGVPLAALILWFGRTPPADKYPDCKFGNRAAYAQTHKCYDSQLDEVTTFREWDFAQDR